MFGIQNKKVKEKMLRETELALADNVKILFARLVNKDCSMPHNLHVCQFMD